MNETDCVPIREFLQGFAALVVSIASLLSLCWGLYMVRDYGSRDTDPFPSFLRDAALRSFIIVFIGAFAIGPFWRASPFWLAFVASAPYLLFALASVSTVGFSIWSDMWSTAGFIVFSLFYVITRFYRVSPKVA